MSAPPEEESLQAAPAPRTDEELVQLAEDILDGKVFGSWNAPPGEVTSAFMLLSLTPLPPGEGDDKVAHVYEYLDKAGPLSVNGLPCFLSCHYLRAGEWARLCALHAQLKTAREVAKATVLQGGA